VILRKHQAEIEALAWRIHEGEAITKIYAAVTPGGGKSALPPILSDILIGGNAFDSIVWVVPRNSLRDQGEGDFASWSQRGFRIRAAGNSGDPFRGYAGYITTYQAIVADPGFHRRALRGRRFILFLDEPHHRLQGGPWDTAIAPLEEAAGLVVYASGTFARGDGQAIAGIDYQVGRPVFLWPNKAAVIYSRGDALREGAIVPVEFRYLDGRTEWEEEGGHRSAGSLAGGDYASQALFTALRTEYALELLDETVADWRRHRAAVYPGAKLLVVAPSIALAKTYQDHLHRRKIDALIATSDDDAAAREAIARFKGQAPPEVDALDSVGMCYEGLSVPAVTHIACLTHIRSIPWLEQCFARSNRTAPGKVAGFVYGPNDERFRAAIASIEAEQVQALKDRAEREGGTAGEESEGQGGQARKWIQPLRSEAIRLSGGTFEPFDDPEAASYETARPDGGLTPSAAEHLLRNQIARHLEIVLGRMRPGSKGPMSKILFRKLKETVGGKSREDCTTEELARQWAWLKEKYPV
jgi:superfamily II DNA or RNA helicase